jgi:hypothetical protein
MSKKKKMKMSLIIENREALRDLKRINRAPKPGLMQPDGSILPKGWESMSKEAIAVDAKRRAKHNYYSRKRKTGYSVVFTYSPTELGLPEPQLSDEDMKMLKELNPAYAKKVKYGKISNLIQQKVSITRDNNYSFKEQWNISRDKTKDYLIEKIKEEQTKIANARATQYNPEMDTTIDLNTLTTIGEENASNE